MKKYQFVPSLLSANFLNLEQELNECLENGVEWFHYDVMDFHFVPNLTFGSKILNDIAKIGKFKIDIHFMVDIVVDYEQFFSDYLKAKPKMMTMHYESLKNKNNILKFIEICQKNQVLSSIAISPDTPIEVLQPYLAMINNVLVMSVHPGFGGQKFIDSAVEKIRKLDEIRRNLNLNYTIEVDGGINSETVDLVKQVNVDLIVAGSYYFESKDRKQVVLEIEK